MKANVFCIKGKEDVFKHIKVFTIGYMGISETLGVSDASTVDNLDTL